MVVDRLRKERSTGESFRSARFLRNARSLPCFGARIGSMQRLIGFCEDPEAEDRISASAAHRGSPVAKEVF
jgi:hypothetical protein